MKKLLTWARRRKGVDRGGGEETESRLTEPEMDAALQLIQLSGDSDSGRYCNNAGDEESVTADAVSDNIDLDEAALEAFPRPRKRKFRSVVDLYQVTQPVRNKSNKKPGTGKNFRN
ncbi:unnamed protein product [Cuscuta europaea]|uniref:Uncharacterized protein n=1 Tax=Cuscuta europaea TaxID=41803 RepID=A0A9P1DXV2_CUSEU|nr:unnamed protein product [Cuscuta europaea]